MPIESRGRTKNVFRGRPKNDTLSPSPEFTPNSRRRASAGLQEAQMSERFKGIIDVNIRKSKPDWASLLPPKARKDSPAISLRFDK